MSLPTPAGYQAFDEQGLIAFLATLGPIRDRLGGDACDWVVREVGDGNLNLVFLVEGSSGDICVKQALPYVRLVGESWPLPLERAFFEFEAASQHSQHAARLVPQLLHYDPKLFLIVMERLSPHIIMRQGMIEATVYPRFAEDITDYLAATIFGTSDLSMAADEKKARVALFAGNTELCRITEDLIFTDPYTISERNRWTSPQLDTIAAEIRSDASLKRAVASLKWRFMTRAEALLHGDLHTGSIMLTTEDTRVIDPEFAFYGPMGFDVGKLIGNLLLCYFSQSGHETRSGERDEYRRWILASVEQVWNLFAQKFQRRWSQSEPGEGCPKRLYCRGADDIGFKTFQQNFMRDMFIDALGYAGTSMIRRTLGLAHNIDMESIGDPDLRAACETRNLRLAVELIKTAPQIPNIEAVTAQATLIQAG